MALTTKSINTVDKDMTPEYYTAIDSEGKGYLAKRKPIVEEPIVEETVKIDELIEKPKKKRKSKK